jgi:hypothetical protein
VEEMNRKILLPNAISGHNVSKVVCSIMLAFLLAACATSVKNIQSPAEIQGRKVLAGRFLLFVNDMPADAFGSKVKFIVRFKENGQRKERIFVPDSEGYVYIPVNEGEYNLASFVYVWRRVGISSGGYSFPAKGRSCPHVRVNSDDSVVNFGTLELNFYESTASKVTAILVGFGKANLRVSHTPNWDVTRSAISKRVGKFAGQIRDAQVFWRENFL